MQAWYMLCNFTVHIQVLRQQVPDHGFLGEEGGVSGNADSEYLWCIDPIDGTTNFAAGYPSFGVSVAGVIPFYSCSFQASLPHNSLALAQAPSMPTLL